MPGKPTRERLRDLLKELSLEHRVVQLSSGGSSSVYVDCKQTALHPEGALALGTHLYTQLTELEREIGITAMGVGGMSIGADPLATAVSLAAFEAGRFLPAFLVRKDPKSHGTQAYLEGLRNIPEDSPVILLEDVVTTGGSTLRAAERVRAAGLRPFAVSLIIDREAGGMENLAADGIPAKALFTLSELS